MERLANEYVEIFNNTSGTVSVRTDKTRLIFPAPTRAITKISKKYPKVELMDLYNSPGIAKMFEQEILLIKDAEIRELLGLNPLTQYTKTIEELGAFLSDSNLADFEDFVAYCSDQVLENLFELAKSKPNKDLSKNEILRRYTGKDAYKMYQEIKEEEEAAGTKSSATGRVPLDGSKPSTGDKPARRRVEKQ